MNNVYRVALFQEPLLEAGRVRLRTKGFVATRNAHSRVQSWNVRCFNGVGTQTKGMRRSWTSDI